MKTLDDVVESKVVIDKKCNALNTKVNSLENKISDLTTLIYLNQYSTDNWRYYDIEKIGDFDTKIPYVSGLMTTTFLNTKTSEVEK